MPTGYTAGIEDGKITSLRDYALTCARAFGACLTMRDEPLSTPIPEKLTADTAWSDGRIAEAKAKIERLLSLTPEQCDQEAAAAFDLAVKVRAEREVEKASVKRRYDAIRRATLEWSPPPTLSELRSFMLQQIDVSTQHINWSYPEPVRQTGTEWFAASMKEASRALSSATEEREKTIRRTDEANAWLAELRWAVAVWEPQP